MERVSNNVRNTARRDEPMCLKVFDKAGKLVKIVLRASQQDQPRNPLGPGQRTVAGVSR